MWTKANRLLLNPIKTLQMREEKKESHKRLPWMPGLNMFFGGFFSEAYSNVSISEILHFHSGIRSAVVKPCICPWLYQVRLTDSKQSLALIDHIDPTLISLYVAWPLTSFSLSFLSDSITASLQERLRASRSHEQTATLTPAAGSRHCNYVRPCPLCFHPFVYRGKN